MHPSSLTDIVTRVVQYTSSGVITVALLIIRDELLFIRFTWAHTQISSSGASLEAVRWSRWCLSRAD